jgi:hypothetical protein
MALQRSHEDAGESLVGSHVPKRPLARSGGRNEGQREHDQGA